MHVSSDMMNEQEIERVNNGENVVVAIDKDCSAGYRFRDGCDIMILSSPHSHCEIFFKHTHYTARPYRGLEVTKIFDKANRLIAYKYRITSYKLYGLAYSNLTEGKFVLNPKRISFAIAPVRFLLSCWKNQVDHLGTRL